MVQDCRQVINPVNVDNCKEELTLPLDVWQKMSCESELQECSDCVDTEDSDKDLDLTYCDTEPLLGNLNFNEEIPDMESFRKTPSAATSSEEKSPKDEQALYQDSPITLGESSLLLMAFSVRHKLSGIALEDLLELIQLHCPKPNRCITELKEFHLFFHALKHPIVKHFYCPNLICKVYVGASQPENGAKCVVCGTQLTTSAYFIEIPVVEQLKTILAGMFITMHEVKIKIVLLSYGLNDVSKQNCNKFFSEARQKHFDLYVLIATVVPNLG